MRGHPAPDQQGTVELLERLGHEVAFPVEQTCCGQLHVNGGYRSEALALARRFVDVLSEFGAPRRPRTSS